MKPFQALAGYFRGVAAEMRKVVWPTPATLGRYFLSVVIGVALATAFIWAMDALFVKGLALIIHH